MQCNRTVSDAIKDSLSRHDALGYIALAQAKTENIAVAKVTAQTLTKGYLRDKIFSAIAVAQAKLEGYPATECWIETLTDSLDRSLCVVALTVTL